MNYCGALTVFIRAYRGYECGYTGTDVLTHNYRNCRSVGDSSRGGKRLKNTDRCRGGLDDSGKDKTCKNTKNGVFKHSKYGFEASSGGEITIASQKQAGGVVGSTNYGHGGEIRYYNTTFESGSQTSSGNKAPSTTVTKKVTYTSDKGNAIQYYGTSSAKWRSDNTPKQGTWGYGAHTAWWFFGDDFENISSKNVTKVEITFTRNSGGNSSKVSHKFYVHNYEKQPKDVTPSYKSSCVGSASVATGNSATISITDTDLIELIKKGKGICAIPTSQSKTYYSVMAGTMKVKFTYKE